MSKNNKKVNIEYDRELYEDDRSNFNSIIQEDTELEDKSKSTNLKTKLTSFTAPKEAFDEVAAGEHDDPFKDAYRNRISSREDDYHKKRYRQMSPPRYDPLKDYDKLPESNARTYKDIMLEQKIQNEKNELMNKKSSQKPIKQGESDNIKLPDKKTKIDRDSISVTSESSNVTKLTNNKSETFDWDLLDKKENIIEGISNSKWETPGYATRRKRWDMTPAGDNMISMRGNNI